VPENISPIFLPSRAPELNPVENVRQYLRQNWLSNTVFYPIPESLTREGVPESALG
jgi:transposase